MVKLCNMGLNLAGNHNNFKNSDLKSIIFGEQNKTFYNIAIKIKIFCKKKGLVSYLFC